MVNLGEAKIKYVSLRSVWPTHLLSAACMSHSIHRVPWDTDSGLQSYITCPIIHSYCNAVGLRMHEEVVNQDGSPVHPCFLCACGFWCYMQVQAFYLVIFSIQTNKRQLTFLALFHFTMSYSTYFPQQFKCFESSQSLLPCSIYPCSMMGWNRYQAEFHVV